MNSLPTAVFAGVLTSSSSALFVILLVVWAVAWGVISLAVVSTWMQARAVWISLGVLGPLGPIIALIIGLTARSRTADE